MPNLYKQPETYAALPAGFVFGANLRRSQMSNPENIRSQMVMKQPNNMLKTFLSATASSALAFSLIDLFGGPLVSRTVGYNAARSVIGGLTLGVGMNLGGACPGTVLAQLGSSLAERDGKALKRSLVTLLGGLIAAGLVSSNQGLIESKLGSFGSPWTLMDVTGVKSFWKLGIPFAAALFSIVGGVTYMEQILNNHEQSNLSTKAAVENQEEKVHKPSPALLKEQSLRATYVGMTSGLMMGMMQIPFYFFGRSYIGTSTFYVSLVEPIVKNPYTEARTVFKNAFQTLSNIGIVLGSYFVASRAISKENRIQSQACTTEKEGDSCGNCQGKTSCTLLQSGKCLLKNYAGSFVSGFLLIAGARIMEGCTSGHGLSGMAMLSIPSFLSVGSMFAGGMISAQIERLLCKAKSS